LEAKFHFGIHPCGFISLARGDLLLRLGTIVSKVHWNILGLQLVGDWFY